MKEQAIQKINKVGKISYIIAVIAKVFVIVGLVSSLVGVVICFAVPEDAVKMTMRGNMIVEADMEAMGGSITQTDLDDMQQSLEEGGEWRVETVQNGIMNGSLEINSTGQVYEPVSVEVEGNKVKIDMISEDTSFTLRDIAGLWLVAMVSLIMTIVTLSFVSSLCKAFRDCASPFEENVIKKMQNLAISLIPWTIISTVSESILNSVASNRIQWSITVDMGVVLIVLVVLILVYIFKYGAVLQQESDETL